MGLYTARRIGLAVAIVFCAMAILFGMVYLIPGDPATIALGPARDAGDDRAASASGWDSTSRIPVQFWNFVAQRPARAISASTCGATAASRRIIAETLPHTLALTGDRPRLGGPARHPARLLLGGTAQLLVDRLTGVISVGAIAMPSFVVALLLPARSSPSGCDGSRRSARGSPGELGDQLSHLVLPAFAIGLGWVGYLARLVRASMLEVMGESHIRTARAFGLPERTRRLPLRAAHRDPADDHAARHRHRQPPLGRGVRRDRVRPARHRQADLRRGAHPQLSGRHGRGAGHHRPVRPLHAARRPRRGLVSTPVSAQSL